MRISIRYGCGPGRRELMSRWQPAAVPVICLTSIQPNAAVEVIIQGKDTTAGCSCGGPVYAHHDPYRLNDLDRYPATGQHLHDYEITLLFGTNDISIRVTAEVERQKKPVWLSESTAGMKNAE